MKNYTRGFSGRKKYNKGFISSLVVIVAAILIVGGWIYAHHNDTPAPNPVEKDSNYQDSMIRSASSAPANSSSTPNVTASSTLELNTSTSADLQPVDQ